MAHKSRMIVVCVALVLGACSKQQPANQTNSGANAALRTGGCRATKHLSGCRGCERTESQGARH